MLSNKSISLAHCLKPDFSAEIYEMGNMKEKAINFQMYINKAEENLVKTEGFKKTKKYEVNREELKQIVLYATNIQTISYFVIKNFGKIDEFDMQQVFQRCNETSAMVEEIMKIKDDSELLKRSKIEVSKQQRAMECLCRACKQGVWLSEIKEMRMCWEYIAMRVDNQNKYIGSILRKKETV